MNTVMLKHNQCGLNFGLKTRIYRKKYQKNGFIPKRLEKNMKLITNWRIEIA